MFRALVSTVLISIAGLAPAMAMTVEGAPLPVLEREADLIVHGHVIATRSYVFRGKVWTDATVMVWSTLGGDRRWADPSTVAVRIPGGTADGWVTVVPGAPAFRAGDEVLLLLEERGGVWLPIGYHLGTFFVGRAGALRRVGPAGRPAETPATLVLDDALERGTVAP